ncbi:hypothetical protein ABTD98_19980, partial [Acinetobacter baumannii]
PASDESGSRDGTNKSPESSKSSSEGVDVFLSVTIATSLVLGAEELTLLLGAEELEQGEIVG